MSSIQERLQLKRVPLDTWNIREQLCLASAVVRSGDQNWMSVSRALKTVGEPNRPADWYSQKSCAAQYGALLEHVETPKRKKRSSEGAVETPQESILKRLTQERIVEIQKNLAEMNQQYEQMTAIINEAHNPATSEERLHEIWTSIEAAKRVREREAARRALWLKEREERQAKADKTWRPPTQITPTSPATPAPPASPLLTSLLKSSPVVTTPQHISHPANVVETISPSATAPTLSMLLEKSAPSGATQHESKHAAIEHIKNQLVQIEQQLKASTSTPPVSLAPTPPAPAVDIDDIEIKAEDVYAFRDIDIHIPPVTTMHKGNVRTDKPPFKKEDGDIPIVTSSAMEVDQNVVKEEPIVVEDVSVEVLTAEIEPPPEEPPVEEKISSEEAPKEVKISFPEVKFPTPEIKVIQPDEIKIKEEVKEPEVVAIEPETTAEEEVIEEEITATVIEEPSKEEHQPEPVVEVVPEVTEPEVVAEEQVSEELVTVPDPASIPLPPDPEPELTEVKEEIESVPLPEEEVQTPPVEEIELPAEQTETVDSQDSTVEVEEPKTEVVQEIKKEEDAEDSIPLKEMIKEAVQPPSQAADDTEERPTELEDTHTETDDDTPMEVNTSLHQELSLELQQVIDDGRRAIDAFSHHDEPQPIGDTAGDLSEETQRLIVPKVRSETPLLSREEEKDGKKKRDYSRKKKSDSRTCSGSESAAEASAPESPSASDAEREHRLWKKSVMLVYSRLCAHKYASLFLRPISDEEAPDYSIVVKRPMDLSTIRRNIDAGITRTTAQFQRDVLLMLSNALMYNSSEHSVYTMAKEMHEEAQCQLGMLLAAQAHAGLSAAPCQRRKRRRLDEQTTHKHKH